MADPLYIVTFPDPQHRDVVTVRVREVGDSPLGPMFVRIAGFQFATGRIIDPTSAALESRYEGTKALHLNRMSLLSVEEVSDVELSISEAPNVVQFRPND